MHVLNFYNANFVSMASLIGLIESLKQTLADLVVQLSPLFSLFFNLVVCVVHAAHQHRSVVSEQAELVGKLCFNILTMLNLIAKALFCNSECFRPRL